jgi:MFS-type transporter involved in bile tolerance (Atg22 family)
MSATQIGVFSLFTLLATLPGTQLGAFVTRRTNPNTSLRLSMLSLLAALIVGAIVLDGLENENLAYIWGACMGVLLGWFYPTENLFFSMVLPKGQEAELAGFYVYCTQVLAWLPPLLFTILVEKDVSQKWGVVVTSFGFLVAAGLLTMAAPWEDIVKEAQQEHAQQSLEEAAKDVEATPSSDEEGNEELVVVSR